MNIPLINISKMVQNVFYTYLACLLVALIVLSDGKKVEDLEIIVLYKPQDCPITARKGDLVSVHYTGLLETGIVFDTSRKKNREAITFILGVRKVIQGWDRGLEGMCVGERRKLIIPPELAYGKIGHPPSIPEDATLTFETEMMHVEKSSTMDEFVRFVRFMSVPTAVISVFYYLYQRANKAADKSIKGKKILKKKK